MAYSKYNNVKVKIDGIKFASKAEAVRYSELRILEKAGDIRSLILQPKFELQAKFRHNGKAERAITYIADFLYYEVGSDKAVVEDVKGVRTQVFDIKRKLFLWKYGEEYELRLT